MFEANSKFNASERRIFNLAKEEVQCDQTDLTTQLVLFKEYLRLSKMSAEQFRALSEDKKDQIVGYIRALVVTAKASLGLYTKA